jgi:acetyl-CoA/propionyl-CoA carboxylase biotin carboxyl carrier protein
LPSPGRITSYREPAGPGVRVDSGVASGSEVSDMYDPMIAKLIVHDTDREHARLRMLRALAEFEIGGVATLVGFHRALLSHPGFIAAETCRTLVESRELQEAAEQFSHRATTLAVAPDGVLSAQTATAEVDGRRVDVRVLRREPAYRALGRKRLERGAGAGRGHAVDVIVSPMQGTVLDVRVADGEEVTAGAIICVIEAMKMENEVTAHRAGIVTQLSVKPGGAVANAQVICVVAEGTEPG